MIETKMTGKTLEVLFDKRKPREGGKEREDTGHRRNRKTEEIEKTE